MKRIRKGMVIFAAALLVLPLLRTSAQNQLPMEAPAAFDNLTNGHISQDDFDDFRDEFEEEEEADEGLGPTFNNTSCANCHSVPVTGGSSQEFETRAGRVDANGTFQDHPGGSVVQDRAINPKIRERVLPGEYSTKRASLNVLGDGFVEAISDSTLLAIQRSQPANIQGTAISVFILEGANGTKRLGRFGWKDQHASLE